MITINNIFIVVFLFLFIVCSHIGSILYQDNLEKNNSFNIYNYTNSLEFKQLNCSSFKQNLTQNNFPDLKIKRLDNIICSMGDCLLTISSESVKFAIEFGYNHPEYDFKYYINLLKYYLIISLLISFFPLIIPSIALIYLIFIPIKKLIHKLQNKFKKNEN